MTFSDRALIAFNDIETLLANAIDLSHIVLDAKLYLSVDTLSVVVGAVQKIVFYGVQTWHNNSWQLIRRYVTLSLSWRFVLSTFRPTKSA